MTRFITIQVIAVLMGMLLPLGNPPSAGELIAPTRTLDSSGKPEGKLMVFSEPPGLPVSLDGQSLGKTPTSIEKVDTGTHSLQVETKATEITIETGQTLAISLFKGKFVKIHEPEEPTVLPPEKQVTPPAESRPSPAASGEPRPPLLSPIEHRRMFGYY
jgi:hypothetical protein